MKATKTPVTIPRRYRAIITSAPYLGKKASTKNAYIGSFAEQLINGVRRMVILLSRSLGSVRVAMTAGTVHPNPMSIGTILLPDSPKRLSILSITKATLAI